MYSKTKTEAIDHAFCSTLWGDDDFQWVWKPSIGSASGLLIIWRKNMISLEENFGGNDFVDFKGVLREESREVFFVNVNVSCDYRKRREMWR